MTPEERGALRNLCADGPGAIFVAVEDLLRLLDQADKVERLEDELEDAEYELDRLDSRNASLVRELVDSYLD